jgi:hypothetical protein
VGRARCRVVHASTEARERERINTSEIPDDSIWNGRGYKFDVSNSRASPKINSLLTLHSA